MKDLNETQIAQLELLFQQQDKQALITYVQTNLQDIHLTSAYLGQIFEILSDVEYGIGKKLSIEYLKTIHSSFETTNGCTWARDSVSYLGKRYLITRTKKGPRVASVKLDGFNKNRTKSARTISTDVQKALKGKHCAVLDIISSNGMEIDHKNGRYDDRENENPNEQKLEDFQVLSKAVNIAKRQHCKECRESGIRYDAKQLGYSESYIFGDEHTKVCNGCYWFDPQQFNAVISKNFKKEK
jgi:hypothetical protein